MITFWIRRNESPQHTHYPTQFHERKKVAETYPVNRYTIHRWVVEWGGNLLNTKKKWKCEIYAPKWSCWAGQRRKPSGVAVVCQTRWPTGGNNSDCPGSLSLSFLFYNKIKHTHLERQKKKSPALHTLRLWLGETAVWYCISMCVVLCRVCLLRGRICWVSFAWQKSTERPADPFFFNYYYFSGHNFSLFCFFHPNCFVKPRFLCVCVLCHKKPVSVLLLLPNCRRLLCVS